LRIITERLSKKFNQHTVFSNFTYQFLPGKPYVLIGPNGSGKSTLLKVITGMIPPTSGTISYTHADGQKIPDDECYKHFSFSSPYMSLPEELTVNEQVRLHLQLRDAFDGLPVKEVMIDSGLKYYQDMPVKRLSSGLQQRLKLMLMFIAPSHCLIFDEPSTNLDPKGVAWFIKTLSFFLEQKVVIIASNNDREIQFDVDFIDMEDHK
jgi:ABC-type multidrug transport system ATPase subunit